MYGPIDYDYSIIRVVCVLVFGFNQSTFRAVEQGQSYTIEIGYWSGSIPNYIFGRVELTLEGTTSEFVLFRLASVLS